MQIADNCKGANWAGRASSSRNAPARLHPSLLHRPVTRLYPQSQCDLCLCFPNSMFRSGLIEISTVDRGVISLFGVRSGLFVAMNSRGRLYGTVRLCATSEAPPPPFFLSLSPCHTHIHTYPVQCKTSSYSCCIHDFMSAVVLLICRDDRGASQQGPRKLQCSNLLLCQNLSVV